MGEARVAHVRRGARRLRSSSFFVLDFITNLTLLLSLSVMAPKKSTKSYSDRVNSDSPYVQKNILKDAEVTVVANNLRALRPCLRARSALIKRMPFMYTAIKDAPSLYDWVTEEMPAENDDGSDFILVRLCCHAVVLP